MQLEPTQYFSARDDFIAERIDKGAYREEGITLGRPERCPGRGVYCFTSIPPKYNIQNISGLREIDKAIIRPDLRRIIEEGAMN